MGRIMGRIMGLMGLMGIMGGYAQTQKQNNAHQAQPQKQNNAHQAQT